MLLMFTDDLRADNLKDFSEAFSQNYSMVSAVAIAIFNQERIFKAQGLGTFRF